MKQKNHILVTLSVMLATIMQALDGTIANVALPHMQGTMGATQDQISWVLTSYIVAAAIFLPLTGYLAERYGRKRIIIWSVIGFTIASAFCGMAQNLTQIVLYRFLQGVLGASLVPLSQAILLDTYPKEKHAPAMAIWGIGVMVGPILGPLLGGWLTENYNWRWVFYINVPFGILAWIGLKLSIQETAVASNRHFDFLGFSFLAISLGALQLLLDRGETLDWFSSREIILEGITTGLFFYLFIVHVFNIKDPFINPKIFKDRNFTLGLFFIFIVGIILLATMALLPSFMQNLLNYPVIDVGVILAPRGLGTMFAMVIVGKLSSKVDTRLLIAFGFLLTTLSLWQMTQFNSNVTANMIIYSGVIQGIGLGFIFVPLSAISFSSLPVQYRNEATAMFSLLRNIGSSIGISVVTTLLAQNIQANHAAFAPFITANNEMLQRAFEQGVFNLTPPGIASLNMEVSRQAMFLAYLQDFRLMMWITFFTIPFLFLLKNTKNQSAHQAILE